MYSQSDETDILVILEIKILLPNHGLQTYKEFF